MSHSIETKTVEFNFNNKNFEENAKQSMNTLQKLKEVISKTTSKESVADLGKIAAESADLSGIESMLSGLQKRFGAFGTFTGRIIENLADGVTGVLGRGLNYVKTSVIEGGIRRAQNIENAHFSLQALLKDEMKVQEIMDNAMQSVDGTAYAYDEAAKAAASFAATGIQGGEEMTRYLKGITGVAAMTNSEYEGISRIFTTVAGNGRLMGDQLLQLSSRGLNAAATIADYFREVRGQTTMTEQAIRDMVSSGEVSFETFASAMEWAFGESAFRANETFTGAMSNMKSAFSRIGAEFIAPLVAQNSKVVELFNTIRIKTNEFKKAITFGEGDVRNSIFGKSFSQQFTDNVLQIASNISKLIESLNANAIMRAVYNIRDGFNNLGKAIVSWVDPAYRALMRVFGTDSNSIYGGMRKLSQAFKDWTATLSKANFGNSKFLVGKELQDGWEGVLNVVKLLITAFGQFVKAISPVDDVFRSIVTGAVSLFGAFGRLLTSLSQIGTTALNTFQPFETFGRTLEAISHVVSVSIEAFAGLFSKFTQSNDIIGKIADTFSKFGTLIEPYITSLGESFDKLLEKMELLTAEDVITWFENLGSKVTELFNSFKELPIISDIIDAFRETFQWENILENIENVQDGFKTFSEYITNNFANGLETAGNTFETFKSKVKLAWDWIKKNWSNPFADVKGGDIVNSIIGVGSVYATIEMVKTFKNLQESLLSLPNAVTDVLKQLKETLKSYEKDIDANRLLKLAGAVALFAVSIGALASVGDWKTLAAAGLGLAAVSAAILFGMAKMEESRKIVDKTGENLSSALKNLGNDVGSAIKTMAAAVFQPMKIMAEAEAFKIKHEAMGKYLKDLGITLLMIVGAIGAMTALIYYRPEELRQAVIVVGAFVAAVGIISLALSSMMKSKNVKSDMATVIASFAKGWNFKMIASGLKDITEGLLLITASVAGMALLNHFDEGSFNKALVIIVALGATMGAMMVLMPKLLAFEGAVQGGSAMIRAAAAMLIVVGSLNIIVNALRKLMNINLPEDYKIKLGTMAGIIVSTMGIIYVLSKAGQAQDGKIFKAGSAFAAIGISMFAIVKALESLMKIEFTEHWVAKLSVLAAIIVALLVFVKLMGEFSAKGASGLKGAASILSLAVAIGAIVIALKTLQDMDDRNILKGAISLGICITALGVAFKGIGAITKDAGKSVQNMAIVIAAITASLAVLSFFNFGALMKGVVSLSAVLLALSSTFKSVSAMNGKEWPAVVAFIGVVAAVAASLYFLAEQPWQGLLAGAIAMDAVLICIGTTFQKLNGTNITANRLKLFGAAIGVVAAIAVSLYFLAEHPWQSLLAGAIAMDAVLIALGQVMNNIGNTKVKKEAIIGFLASAVALIPIAFAIRMLAGFEWPNLIGAAASIAVAILSIAGTMKIIDGVKINITNGLALVAGIAAVAAIGYILSQLANNDWQSMLGVAVAIGSVLLVIGVVMGIATLVGAFSAAAQAGLLLMLEFMALYTLFLTGLGALWKIEGFQNLINGGIEALTRLGQGIGQFIGGIVNGVISQVSAALPQLGQDLSDFMNNAKAFFEGIGQIDEGTAMAAKSLAQCILYLAAAEVVNALTSWLTGKGSLDEFGTELESFGPKLASFAEATSGINAESVKGAAEATERLAEMASNLERHGGVLQFLIGDNTLTQFALELQSYGPRLANFVTATANVTLESVKGAAEATERLAEMASKIEPHHGLIQAIMGDNLLSDFGTELASYAPDLVYFSSAVSSVTKQSVLGAAQATERLAEMAGKISNTGGFLGFFTGDSNKLTKFGNDLSGYGVGLANFHGYISTISVELINSAVEATEKLINIFNEMADLDPSGVANFNAAILELANNSIDLLVNNLKNGTTKVKTEMSNMIKSMADAIKSRQPDVINALKTLCSQFLNTWNTQSTTMKSKFLETGKTIINKFNEGIKSVWNTPMTSMKTFCSEIISTLDKGLPPSKFTEIATRSIMAFTNGVTATTPTANASCRTLAETCLNILNGFVDMFWGPGEASGNKYADGMRQAKGNVEAAARSLADAAAGAIGGAEGSFHSAGSSAGAGFASGISSQASAVRSAAASLASAASTSLNRKLVVKSPSRVTMKTGNYFTEGFAEGIKKRSNLVLGSINDLAKIALGALEEVTDNEFGLDPVITPYLDLSQINRDVQSLNNLLENGSIGVRQGAGQVLSDGTVSNGATFNFTQNNYSPTALSRAEIYRQTNNQFSRLRGMVSLA